MTVKCKHAQKLSLICYVELIIELYNEDSSCYINCILMVKFYHLL